MNLLDIRKKIDLIDEQIIRLLSERIKCSEDVAYYKKNHNIAQFQKEREKEMLRARVELGESLSLSSEFIEELWGNILSQSHKVQKPIVSNAELGSAIKKGESENVFLKWNKGKKLKYCCCPMRIKLDIFELFSRIYANFDDFFFLESLGQDKEFSRYSYLGFGSKMQIQARGEKIWIDNKEIECGKNPWDYLCNNFPLALLPESDDFQGGLVGYNSFESFQYREKSISLNTNFDQKNKEGGFFDFEFALYSEGLKYNLSTGLIEYFTLAENNSAQIEEILQSPVELSPLKVEEKGSNMSDEEFENIVNDLKKEIVKGNIFQIVPSRKYFFDIQGSTLEIYKNLREQNPSPHMFFLKFGERELIGSSPELVARVEGQSVESYPIAGTRSRGKTDEEDLQLEKELLSDAKEVAEHMMLVDMARDDLGRVCEYASVKVDKLKVVKKFSHVQHIVSHVSGKLMKDKNAFDAVMASFPMGTVSGAPRIEAYKLIQQKEKAPRGPYSGSVGFFSFSGSAVAALPIRSLFIDNGSAYTQAGAGVVHDSIPEFERKEVEKKMGAIKKALLSF